LAEKTIKQIIETIDPSPKTVELRVNKDHWKKRLLRGAWLLSESVAACFIDHQLKVSEQLTGGNSNTEQNAL